MNNTDQYTFEEYYDIVVGNVSKRVLNEYKVTLTKEPLYEIIFDMYRLDINTSQAVVLLESFYSKFKNFLC